MKKLCVVFILFLQCSSFVFSQVGINMDGSSPDGSAMLDVKSKSKGFLPPRMTRAEVTAIPSPSDGLIVYCTDCGPGGSGGLSMYMAGVWVRIAITYMEPVVTTTAISSITSTYATSGGNITSDGGSAVTVRGVCWATSQNPTIANSKTVNGTGSGAFTSNPIGLLPGTTYYLKAYATNDIGTAYGNQVTFTTNLGLPTLTTTVASNIARTVATSGGTLINDGGTKVTARGICWRTVSNPTTANNKTINGNGMGTFTSDMSLLTDYTTYFVRAYATTSVGTGYGNEVSFMTLGIGFNPNLTYGTVNDIDGNTYKTITIGTQTWMAENLKTTKYRNGEPINNVKDNTAWAALTSGAYCWYYNDSIVKKSLYGALYNWYAISDSRNIAPIGWHVPTDAEVATLVTFLGGENVAGGKLKEQGLEHWVSPNSGSTNSSGYSALPGGYRTNNGTFDYDTESGNWWSTLEFSATEAKKHDLDWNNDDVYFNNTSKKYGCSVRCIKD